MHAVASNLRKAWGAWVRWIPAALVTIVGVWLIWPIPLGRMPMSGDHPVHLTRAWMWAQTLARGEVRGWSDVWFVGTPVGELYPVLGDLGVIAIRWSSFGSLSWPQAYALAFTIMFVGQGWALLRAGRVLELGPLPGLFAALLAMADVGGYREGGWIYTVWLGVWPQCLATSLVWVGFAELIVACRAETPSAWRASLPWAGAAFGAALLAHPMSLPIVVLGASVVVVVFGWGSRASLQRSVSAGVLVLAFGGALALWWYLPFVRHRAWAASYGWLWLPLDVMLKELVAGRWCQAMPAALGYLAALGLVFSAVAGSRTARAYGAIALLLWLLSSRDLAWGLRLDLLSEGFTQVQYQRFLIAAKPGLYLIAGAMVAEFGVAAQRAWRWPRSAARRFVVVGSSAIVLVSILIVGLEQHRQFTGNAIGRPIQLVRDPTTPELDADYAALTQWLDERWQARDRFFRVTFRSSRNQHWYMDAPTLTGIPLFKQGFTPGDNFVHKPEHRIPAVLDRAQVQFEVVRSDVEPTRAVASFGWLHVVERPNGGTGGRAWLEGSGTVEVLEDDVDAGLVRVRVDGAGPGSRLVFGIAGFPRWSLAGPDGVVEWVEVPMTGDGPSVSLSQRRGGELRGGKAGGDDGTEPTLIAAPVVDGEYLLRYEGGDRLDLVAGLVSAFAMLGLLALWVPHRRWSYPTLVSDGVRRLVGRVVRYDVVVLIVVVLLGVVAWAWYEGLQRERARAVGWARDSDRASLESARTGYIKADMRIRPSIVVDARGRPATATFQGVVLEDELRGWVAIDDDDSKAPKGGERSIRLSIQQGGQWVDLDVRRVPHRAGVVPWVVRTNEFAGRTVAVRVMVEAMGRRPPTMGFDLELAPSGPS